MRSDAEQEMFEERAAIMEFYGGLTRAEAEARARQALPPTTPELPTAKATAGYLAFKEFWHHQRKEK
ncbi:hypothetical protein OYT1_ch1638 [Ferriphaselus amnicola]|uniref:Uncharacterized protein n=1 Tax=Ferriphaselus amnicola TaxID=1188319 RepID=A0A2Z6GDA5_9PROT|nr:hypothetical protein [Ferriphaselus amnicola]BBE51185.1 hypothetical protein OYT1_ch1638 [Ferriphaselus amnicola]